MVRGGAAVPPGAIGDFRLMFLLPPGEGGAQRRMRLRIAGANAQLRLLIFVCNVAVVYRVRDVHFAAVPSPQPLSRRERGFNPSPFGRRCPKGG
ncbi:hypothetical protein XHV734_4738 [Xanthomonas hortorum pv. vitians]|nr:hypothetical protein XHV734_4738 [Xanthomonas hortorum pv. vitians]